MRTVEQTVYQFDELSDRAKETARDWYRDGMETIDYAESVIEDAARIGDIIGINLRTRTARLMGGGTRQEPHVYWSGFSSQGDGASFVGNYSYKAGSVRALAQEAPTGTEPHHKGNNEVNRICRELAEVQRRNFYQLQAVIGTSGRYAHSHTMQIDVERVDDRPVSDADVETVRELMRDFADWIYRRLEREYEYRHSDDVVDEDIRANEYEVDEDGNLA